MNLKPKAEVPAQLDYTPLGADERWRVERFRELAAEFTFAAGSPWEEQMTLFHEVGLSLARPWEFVRRLHGINPVLLPDGASLADYAVLTRAELCAQRGVTDKQLQAELDALRGTWGQVAPKGQPEEAESKSKSRVKIKSGDEELGMLEAEADLVTIRECGFDAKMFEKVMVFDPNTPMTPDNPNMLVARAREKNLEERAWFAARCEDSRKMLKEPMARTIVRDALLNELHINRLQDQLALLTEGTKDFDRFDKRKADLQNRFETQLDRLQAMFPDMNVANRISFRQVISTLIGAERDFYGDNNNKRRDGLFTAAEIQILMRQSVQNPMPQYRVSLSLLVAEAHHGLYDRNFRSALAKKPGLLKKIDALARAAINAAREGHGEALVDLEEGVTPDEGSQFEELIEFEAAPKDGPRRGEGGEGENEKEDR